MQELNLPTFNHKLKKIEGNIYIFDIIRKKYILLTPEEWVRQHFLHYLINHQQYPKSLIKLESGLRYNKLSKRTDIQVYDREGNIFMVIECKAPFIQLTENTFEQAALYNQVLKAPYLTVTNGIIHYYCRTNWDTFKFSFLNELPVFDQIS
ncbi:Type I restriction enzyme R protein N terminus (HSDR_N) [Pseudarcicella hirudinis]|uniref:Type I restriction enzyme R protein N terminus (HSDR_N) n=1 Tax=Pseudarcicella hirudinis TaxID=1079859 RepID=A0A1I5PGL9_9BACT|nr:type I restriction enzyme HsdR N-terminal domain-containing protein [Pseudarcicella hirudinis]SFP33173.1 Type I restriction enzyme R protein N terminus (HSDR_N) [Pseudarcicella hirudinis]